MMDRISKLRSKSGNKKTRKKKTTRKKKSGAGSGKAAVIAKYLNQAEYQKAL